MTLRSLLVRWDRFLFQPVSPVNVSLLRIIWGVLALINILLMIPDRYRWFAPNGYLVPPNMSQPLTRLNLMQAWVHSTQAVDLWFVVLGFALCCVICGFFTRASLLLAWVMLTSMNHQNTLILHSGDTLLRLIGFLLIFSPASSCFSVDAWRAGKPQLDAEPQAPWAQRLIQIQLCIVYFTSAWWKMKGPEWNDGSAVGIVLNLMEFQRFWLPEFMRGPFMSPFLTGFAVTVEALFPILVWFKDTRKVALIAGMMLHVGMDYCMNVQLFQPIIACIFILFISPESLRRALLRVKEIVTKQLLASVEPTRNSDP